MGQAMADSGRMRGWIACALIAGALVTVLAAMSAMGQALVTAMESSPASVSEVDALAPDTSAIQLR